MGTPFASVFSDTATLGVELEFLMLFRESRAQSPPKVENGKYGPSPQRVPEEPLDLAQTAADDHKTHMSRLHYFGNDIAKKLSEAGVPTLYQEKGHPKDDQSPDFDDVEPRLGAFDEFRYSTYKENAIVPEETMIWTDPKADGKRVIVRPTMQQGYFWLGFEFVGKAYRYRDFASTKSDLEIICRVLRANYLVSVNAGKDSETRSGRCGAHVHWGLGGKEYGLITVKRILTLMWVVEERLMDLHASWRRDADKYAALLQKGTNMAMDNIPKLPSWVDSLGEGDWVVEMEQNVPIEVREAFHQNKPKVQWLWRAETMYDLAMLVGEINKSRRASVAVVELLPAASSFPGKVRRSQLNTIEFRHMQGSLDPAPLTAWIEVTAAIIRRCVDSSSENFSSLLGDLAACVSNKNSTVWELLSKLGVAQETCSVFRTFGQQRLDREADPGYSIFLPEL